MNLQAGTATDVGAMVDVDRVVGGQGSDTLIGSDQDTTWTVSGQNAGSVGGFEFQQVENLREMAATVMSVNLSLITINENEVTKRLAAYAALVAVPTMIAGVYGMNFANMPELSWRWVYPAALGSMGLIDLYLVYRFRKAGWF